MNIDVFTVTTSVAMCHFKATVSREKLRMTRYGRVRWDVVAPLNSWDPLTCTGWMATDDTHVGVHRLCMEQAQTRNRRKKDEPTNQNHKAESKSGSALNGSTREKEQTRGARSKGEIRTGYKLNCRARGGPGGESCFQTRKMFTMADYDYFVDSLSNPSERVQESLCYNFKVR